MDKFGHVKRFTNTFTTDFHRIFHENHKQMSQNLSILEVCLELSQVCWLSHDFCFICILYDIALALWWGSWGLRRTHGDRDETHWWFFPVPDDYANQGIRPDDACCGCGGGVNRTATTARAGMKSCKLSNCSARLIHELNNQLTFRNLCAVWSCGFGDAIHTFSKHITIQCDVVAYNFVSGQHLRVVSNIVSLCASRRRTVFPLLFRRVDMYFRILCFLFCKMFSVSFEILPIFLGKYFRKCLIKHIANNLWNTLVLDDVWAMLWHVIHSLADYQLQTFLGLSGYVLGATNTTCPENNRTRQLETRFQSGQFRRSKDSTYFQRCRNKK